MVITSRDNPNVKRIAKLTKREHARAEGVIYLEGTRLCEEALASGQKAIEVIATEERVSWAKEFTPDIEPLILAKTVFAKISQTVNPQGVAIVIKEPQISAEIPSKEDGKNIYVVLENTQDPGNLGTIIRMADAFGLQHVIHITIKSSGRPWVQCGIFRLSERPWTSVSLISIRREQRHSRCILRAMS